MSIRPQPRMVAGPTASNPPTPPPRAGKATPEASRRPCTVLFRPLDAGFNLKYLYGRARIVPHLMITGIVLVSETGVSPIRSLGLPPVPPSLRWPNGYSIEKSLCTKNILNHLQNHIVTRNVQSVFRHCPGCVQHRTIHIPNLFCDSRLQIINCVGTVEIYWVFHRIPETNIEQILKSFGGQIVLEMTLSTNTLTKSVLELTHGNSIEQVPMQSVFRSEHYASDKAKFHFSGYVKC